MPYHNLKESRHLHEYFVIFQKTIDYFKMDVEGSEYPAFEAMFKSGILSKVKQIGFEIHFGNRRYTKAPDYYSSWQLLKQLEEAGFRQWVVGHNLDNTYHEKGHPQMKGQFCCSNLYLININYLNNWNRWVKYSRGFSVKS